MLTSAATVMGTTSLWGPLKHAWKWLEVNLPVKSPVQLSTFLESCALLAGEARSTDGFGTLGSPHSAHHSYLQPFQWWAEEAVFSLNFNYECIFTVKCDVRQWWLLQRPTPSCLLSWTGGRWNERERTLGWWRQQLGEQSNEMTNWGRGSSGKHRWPTETSGGPAKSQGVTWVCWQYLKDPGDSRGNTRKVRIGIESNCLGLFNHHFYSRHDLLLIGFALLRNRWE